MGNIVVHSNGALTDVKKLWAGFLRARRCCLGIEPVVLQCKDARKKVGWRSPIQFVLGIEPVPVGCIRFLTRLLLVHGTLADYRLGRLIKYSFYKNIAFAFMLFFYQFFCGFSGQVSVLCGFSFPLCSPVSCPLGTSHM